MRREALIFPDRMKFGWIKADDGSWFVAVGIEHPGEEVTLALEPEAFERLCQQFDAFLNGGFGVKPN